MKLSDTEYAVIGIVGLGGALWLGKRLRAKKQQQEIIYPGQVFEGMQGQMTTVRLPRGSYTMFNGDNLVHMASQSDAGVYTDVTLVLGDYETDYTVNLVFQENTTKQTSNVTVLGRKVLA